VSAHRRAVSEPVDENPRKVCPQLRVSDGTSSSLKGTLLYRAQPLFPFTLLDPLVQSQAGAGLEVLCSFRREARAVRQGGAAAVRADITGSHLTAKTKTI
jgi:hypothetical protein